MANESARIGANFSNYTGDPGIGGGTLGAVRIDTRPLEDLARYTMLYNREEYLQKQRDAEKAAEELAKFTQIDLSTTIPKDAKILQEKYDKIIEYARQNIGELTYSKNKEKWLEFNKLKADLVNDTKFAATRSLMNISRKEEIAKETSEEVQSFLKKKLQENIDATDIRTPLDHAQKYDVTIPDFGKNLGIKVDVTKAGSNQIFQRDYTLFDLAEARRAGGAVELGFNAIDPNTTTGQLKTIKANENFFVRGAQILNQAIVSAKKADGTIDESKLADLSIMKNINDFNKYVSDKVREINDGIYKDKFGNSVTFGTGKIRQEDYQPINWEDGISPAELAVLAQYSQWAGDDYQTKVIQTNDQIEKERLGVQWYNAKTGRMQEDRLNDQWKATMVGGDTVKNGALERAKRIYKDLEKLTDKNGVISTEKLRQLNAEQLKYLGAEQITESDAGVQKSVFAPLDLSGETPYVVQLVDGQIKVLRDAEFNPSTGKWGGFWDPSKSTNIYNVGTNILNEELSKAGTKELNSYMPIDLGIGGVSTETSGQKVEISGKKSATDVSKLSASPKDWTKEGDLWRYKDGTVYDSTGKVIKQ